MPVDSVQVKEENLQAHLLSPEFFDAEKTPEISFQSTKIRAEDEPGGRRRRADRQAASPSPSWPGASSAARCRARAAATDIGLDLETKVDRHDYGLDWQMELPGGGTTLGDEVTLSVHLELIEGRNVAR